MMQVPSFRTKKKINQEPVMGLLFIAPSLLGFFVFILIPVIASLFLSFTKWNMLEGFEAIKITGLNNYKKLLQDSVFLESYWNNLVFTLVTIPSLTILGLVLSYLINKYIKCADIVKVMLFIPYISSVVAICSVWQVLLQPSYGPVNQILEALGIANPPGWLISSKWALSAIIIIYIWQNVGYYVLVYSAGLKGISPDLYEAAEIDGASAVRQFLSITVPMLSPTTFFLITMGIISSFKVFDIISVLTSGGPGHSTSVMAYYIYQTAFLEFKTGYANTLAWALFILIFVVTIMQSKMQSRFSIE